MHLIRLLLIAVFSLFGISDAFAGNGIVEPRLTIAAGGAAGPRVALTLDACDGRTDMRIVSTLIENHIPATIFATGRWIRSNPAALKLILSHADLFEIENHGARHVPAIDRPVRVYGLVTAGSPAGVTAEVEGGAAAVAEATRRRPAWFRGAAAQYTLSSLALIRSLGFQVAGYSLSADEGALLGTRQTAARIAAAKDGDVIIAHVNHPEKPAGAGVAAGVLALKARGFTFVKLDGAGAQAAGTISRGAGGPPRHRKPPEEGRPVASGAL
jgi:peptidoglycan/xylan/chitin deacetylase (PgdA/CDA1 family)